jgi:hypothetical protein
LRRFLSALCTPIVDYYLNNIALLNAVLLAISHLLVALLALIASRGRVGRWLPHCEEFVYAVLKFRVIWNHLLRLLRILLFGTIPALIHWCRWLSDCEKLIYAILEFRVIEDASLIVRYGVPTMISSTLHDWCWWLADSKELV